MSIEPVEPVEPVAPYLGGKNRLASTICDRIERIEHRTYVEPFAGMGGVFFRRRFRPRAEVINDRNGEIVNLFRILQRHYPQFIDTLKFQITARREFERLRACDPATLTDLERAARFLYIQRCAFGGQSAGVFGVSPDRPGRFDLSQVEPMLADAHERLSSVVLENLDWAEMIDRYDRPATLFYLDPPYFGGESDYGKGIFAREDFARIAERLASIKGAFLLSINDTPEIREIFGGFIIDEVRLSYSVAKQGGGGKVGELIIGNRGVSAGLV